MTDPKILITKIREDIQISRSARLWQDSIHMLSTVSESIFSRSAHFILEILQNAEDSGAKLAGQGEISFYISPERIKVVHNGSPFTDTNVNAICGVRSTKRPEDGTLGYLGIGFKSVFKISDCPQIYSGGFQFKFDKSAYSDPTNEPWQIIPIWVENPPEQLEVPFTSFIMPFRNSETYEQTLKELQKLDVHIFLFLKWLKKLTIIDEKNGETVVIENLGENDGVASLNKKDKNGSTKNRFAIFRRLGEVPLTVAKDSSLEFYKRQSVKGREIVLAFKVDNDNNLQPIEDASALGSVSSFLPLVEERTGAKFLIQSDFLVQPGREAIQYELSWNVWLTEEAASLAKVAIEEFKKHAKWKTQFLPVFKFQAYWAQTSFANLFYPKLQQPITEYLKTADVYPTESGDHVNPSKAVELEEKASGLILDSDLPFIFPYNTGMSLAASNLDVKTIPDEIHSRVQKLDLGQIARNKKLLESKLNQNNYIEWFANLYKAMATTDRYYKEEYYRNGRSYNSPIFVLTDKNTIESAAAVHLREIPRDVIALRTKYPDVDTLLNSYQLIHAKLSTPSLTEFFKERTHIQPIDYAKICRDVFLHKVKIDVQALQKDDLIAYTRLLQKGPELKDVIWVVAANGKIKPSNQVFLGARYSPSEDWEKLSKYATHLDFLSPEYLIDVPTKDKAAWKEFFVRLGSKESGENHDVETFAIEFVKDILTSELINFKRKDRQQHGYDLEAENIKTGALVKIEVKGRKQPGPVDLIGNEPQAAQQAKMNGEPFWVCIVPNIPEHPELWIIDDVTTIGQSNTLTIPITGWKQFGRRVI